MRPLMEQRQAMRRATWKRGQSSSSNVRLSWYLGPAPQMARGPKTFTTADILGRSSRLAPPAAGCPQSYRRRSRCDRSSFTRSQTFCPAKKRPQLAEIETVSQSKRASRLRNWHGDCRDKPKPGDRNRHGHAVPCLYSKFSPQWLFAGIRRERSKLRPDRCRHERDGEARAFDRKFLSVSIGC